MKSELTDRQRDILDFITESTQERGYPPSVREICSHFGMQSTQGAVRHLEALEKKGYLKRDGRAARSLQLTTRISPEESLNLRMVPVLGQVAAGVPIAAIENAEDQIPISKDWLSVGKDYFLLKVKGDSMAEAIQPGDLVLVERQTRAERGSIIVALLEDEATVKRFYREKHEVILRSDNPTYKDIVVPDGSPIEILGRVTGLVRKY